MLMLGVWCFSTDPEEKKASWDMKSRRRLKILRSLNKLFFSSFLSGASVLITSIFKLYLLTRSVLCLGVYSVLLFILQPGNEFLVVSSDGLFKEVVKWKNMFFTPFVLPKRLNFF